MSLADDTSGDAIPFEVAWEHWDSKLFRTLQLLQPVMMQRIVHTTKSKLRIFLMFAEDEIFPESVYIDFNN